MKKLISIFLLLLICQCGFTQIKKRKLPKFNVNKDVNVFLKKQFWLGFKLGTALSSPLLIKEYGAIEFSEANEGTKKKYENFREPGLQAALEVTFYFSGLSISFQPTYRNARFSYETAYFWTDDENPANHLELNYLHEQRNDYLDFPFMAKYEFTKNKLGPYVQAGVYSSVLLNATKSLTVSGIDYASGGINHFENAPVVVGAKDLFAKHHWGVLAGIGTYYNLGNIRLNIDILYKKGLGNISSTENRYGNDQLTGLGDVMDDLKLDNLSFTIGSLFPLRFIGKRFESTEKR